MPGARSTRSLWRSVQRTSAMRGSSRWVSMSPAASTTIQARSNSSPVSITSASVTAMPPHDLIGWMKSWAIVQVRSLSGVLTRARSGGLIGAGRLCRGPLPTMPAMPTHDVLVRGAGAVGLATALALARQGLQVALLGQPPAAAGQQDIRTYALNATSVALLQ